MLIPVQLWIYYSMHHSLIRIYSFRLLLQNSDMLLIAYRAMKFDLHIAESCCALSFPPQISKFDFLGHLNFVEF